jgi:hypothetical protein
MDDVLLKILYGVVAFLGAIFWWAVNRDVQDRDLIKARVMELEKNSITREELQATIREAASDRRSMHEDNQEEIKDMRARIEEFEARRSKTEHAILDAVNQIALKVAVNQAMNERRPVRE